MASIVFSPSDAVDMSKEKDWPASLGLMDWDTTRIVFTKRKLVEFLKYAGVTVDTNYTNISKLPRYAQFMKVTDGDEDGTLITSSERHTAEVVNPSVRPSRRVRTAPGGSTSDIFGIEGMEDDALSQAPPIHETSNTTRNTDAFAEVANVPSIVTEELASGSNSRPSRRVRTAPGGKDSLSELWGSVEGGESEEVFRPTRRVRQTPGGQDNMSGIL